MKFLSKLYANIFGYFWLPCPKCGEMFGGHQVVLGGAYMIVTEADGMHCYCVCPACDTEALRAENRREEMARINVTLSNMIPAKLMAGEAMSFSIVQDPKKW